MTIGQEILTAAARAGNLLDESTDSVAAFIRSRLSGDGGFRGRGGASDLYYTVFGIESLLAVDAEVPVGPIEKYLSTFLPGESLDLVHLACLVRCWACLPGREVPAQLRRRAAARLERFCSAEGGYGAGGAGTSAQAYSCFLAMGAYQDLEIPCPEARGISRGLQALAMAGGGYANQRRLPVATTASTAAAVVLLRQLRLPVEAATARWLRAQCSQAGGFVAVPGATEPDLLATATALHALAAIEEPLDEIRPRCIDFIMSLRTADGGFRGCAGDDDADCEYTFYALLSLGNLSEK